MFFKRMRNSIVYDSKLYVEYLLTNPFMLYSMLVSRTCFIGLIGLLILPQFISFITYGAIFKLIGLYVLTIALFSFYNFIFTHVKGDLFLFSEIDIKEVFKSILKLLFSPLSWLGLISLFIVGTISINMFNLIVLYLLVMIAYEIYSNRDVIKKTKQRVDFMIHKHACDICHEPIQKKRYEEKPFDETREKYGFVCEDCNGKYSPFLQGYFYTIEEIKKHLAYREENLKQPFSYDDRIFFPNWESNYLRDHYNRYAADPEFLIDTEKGKFKIGLGSDILPLHDIKDCQFIVKRRKEEHVTNITVEDYNAARRNAIQDSDANLAVLRAGTTRFYDDIGAMENREYGKVPSYLEDQTSVTYINYTKMYHDFYIDITIDHEYLSNIQVKLNTNPIYENESRNIYNTYVEKGKEVCEKLSRLSFV